VSTYERSVIRMIDAMKFRTSRGVIDGPAGCSCARFESAGRPIELTVEREASAPSGRLNAEPSRVPFVRSLISPTDDRLLPLTARVTSPERPVKVAVKDAPFLVVKLRC